MNSERRWAAVAALGLLGCTDSDGGEVACPAAPEPEAVPFVDATAELGIDAEHHFGTEFCQLTDTVGGPGVCVFDYDGDGALDLYFVDRAGHSNRLFRNDGASVTDATASDSAAVDSDTMACLAFDRDGDGDLDLYLSNVGADQLLDNDGAGNFVDISSSAGIDVGGFSSSATAGDIDGDGDLDLFVARVVDLSTCPDECYLFPVACDAEQNALLVNDGGSFTEQSAARGIDEAEPTLAPLFVDFDRDGDADLYVGNDMGAFFPDRFYVNDGTGNFVDVAQELGLDVPGSDTMGVDIGDYDLDGTSDFVITDFKDRPLRVLRCFEPELPCSNEVVPDGLDYVKWGVGFVDFDQDGALDLFATAGDVADVDAPSANPNHLYFGNGLGGFEEYLPDAGDALAHEATSRGAAFGDLDGDGDVDVVVANAGGTHQVLRNTAALGYAITIELDTLAAGAVVEMTSERSQLSEHVLIGGSYAGSSDPRVHFGLGPACQADVAVRFLDGQQVTAIATAGASKLTR